MKSTVGLNDILNSYPIFEKITQHLDFKSLISLESTCRSNFKKVRSINWKNRYISYGGTEDVASIDSILLIRNIWRMEEERKTFDSREGARNSIFKRIDLASKITVGSTIFTLVSTVISLVKYIPSDLFRIVEISPECQEEFIRQYFDPMNPSNYF